MQAFSYLQRNIADKNYLKLFIWGTVLFVYLALSALNPYVPPLFGVLIVLAYFVREKHVLWFVLLYLLFFELDRGYYLFSSWLFLFFCIHYLIPFFESFLDCRRCNAALVAFFTYPAYFFMLSAIDMFFLKETITVSLAPIFVYMVFETLIALSLE